MRHYLAGPNSWSHLGAPITITQGFMFKSNPI